MFNFFFFFFCGPITAVCLTLAISNYITKPERLLVLHWTCSHSVLSRTSRKATYYWSMLCSPVAPSHIFQKISDKTCLLFRMYQENYEKMLKPSEQWSLTASVWAKLPVCVITPPSSDHRPMQLANLKKIKQMPQ